VFETGNADLDRLLSAYAPIPPPCLPEPPAPSCSFLMEQQLTAHSLPMYQDPQPLFNPAPFSPDLLADATARLLHEDEPFLTTAAGFLVRFMSGDTCCVAACLLSTSIFYSTFASNCSRKLQAACKLNFIDCAIAWKKLITSTLNMTEVLWCRHLIDPHIKDAKEGYRGTLFLTHNQGIVRNKTWIHVLIAEQLSLLLTLV